MTSTAIPVAVTFHGAPVGRYWQLEDASTDLGAIDTYPTELGKLLLAEFTACFAGDWYRLPVRVPYGSAVHIDALVCTDTFGVATLVPSATAANGARRTAVADVRAQRRAPHPTAASTRPTGAGSWCRRCSPAAWTPTRWRRSPSSATSRPTSAWGIEDIVTNAVGRPIRRSEDLRQQGREPAPDPREGLPGAWVWRLATSVPENWIPLLPTRGRADDDDYLLIQGAMVRYTREADGSLSSVPILPAGLMLRAGGTLPEREIPREGRTLQRTLRLARWVDGGRVRWWSRRTTVGHGQASSGLAYDGLHPTSDTAQSLGQ